ncbi:MAG TPA: cytochrome c [Thermoanaerobaculia bacterium]|nr:cytochrome c [Thermoanaerobaculia bacterium]
MKKTATWMIAVMAAVALASPAYANDSAALFKGKCASCHGQDGSGDTAVGKKMGIADLRSPAVQKKSDGELGDDIANGGKQKKASHAYKNKGLTDAQIKGLVTFIRSIATK